MGKTLSKEKERILNESGDPFAGLLNFGNTCYFNSVLQCLYYCKPFRHHVLPYSRSKSTKSPLLVELAKLFDRISSKKSSKISYISPKQFYNQLQEEHVLFRNNEQQDAQELLNFLLNNISEGVQKQEQGEKDDESSDMIETKTWVHDLFEGIVVSETKCLCCESISTREESFLDLSVDIAPNCSITSCLKTYSKVEALGGDSKYFCDICNNKQPAHKRVTVKRLPQILALHLKRFKYDEYRQVYAKLSHRVVYPTQLRLFDLAMDATEEDVLYELFAIVVHCGSRLSRGHYLSVIRSGEHWILFDDDNVEVLSESDLQMFFGVTLSQAKQRWSHPLETAYMLFYEAKYPSLSCDPLATVVGNLDASQSETDSPAECSTKPKQKSKSKFGRLRHKVKGSNSKPCDNIDESDVTPEVS